MTSVGITGQSGFIGTHLYHRLKREEGISLVPFEDAYFGTEGALAEFAASCDCIVHLSAMNRGDDDELYRTNVSLVRQLIRAAAAGKRKPHILFASSTQENRDNAYGRSKQEGRRLLEDWAREGRGTLTSLLIPNVFGPFGRPFHNSVVGTFCHQLTHGQIPEVHVDAFLPLIPVGMLTDQIAGWITRANGAQVSVISVPPLAVRKVSELLGELTCFRDTYLAGGVFPVLGSDFDVALFNTFHSYIDPGIYPRMLDLRLDERGCLAEIVRSRNAGQAYISKTRPGIVRGNHFHTRKVERFAVLTGDAVVRWRRVGTGEVAEFRLSGEAPAYVDIPVLHTHQIENTGSGDLMTLFWSTELFDRQDPDTFPEKV